VRRLPANLLATIGPVMLTAMSLIIASSIAGCAVGPDYRKPSTTLQPFHSSAALKTRGTSASVPALAQWWLGFDDPARASLSGPSIRTSTRLRLSCDH